MCVCMCVCMSCIYVRVPKCVHVCVRESVCVSVCERDSVPSTSVFCVLECVCVSESARECACVREKEKLSVRVTSVCVRESVRERICRVFLKACVCERETSCARNLRVGVFPLSSQGVAVVVTHGQVLGGVEGWSAYCEPQDKVVGLQHLSRPFFLIYKHMCMYREVERHC